MTTHISTQENLKYITSICYDKKRKSILEIFVVQNNKNITPNEYFVVRYGGCLAQTRISFRRAEYIKIDNLILNDDGCSEEDAMLWGDVQFWVLNNKDKLHLIEILNRPDFWMNLIKTYNSVNPDNKLQLDLIRPDYKQLFHDIEDDDLISISGFGAAGLSQKHTGLPVYIILYEKTFAIKRKLQRMSFQNDYAEKRHDNLISISISENPEILTKNYELNIKEQDVEIVKTWIKKNYKILSDYWNQKIYTTELFEKLGIE